MADWPKVVFHENKGETCTISSGGLPEFPEWFAKEIEAILNRLREEEAAHRQRSASPPPPDAR